MRPSHIIIPLFSCAFFLGISVACPVVAAGPNAAPSFEFQADFRPAFLAPATLTVKSEGKGAQLIIRISDEPVKVSLEASAAAAFLKQASKFEPTTPPPEAGLDGCSVQFQMTVDGRSKYASRAWSPTKGKTPSEHALMEALYQVVDRVRVPSPQAEYLEHLFGYFDGIQPLWKVKEGSPKTVRFYARLSSDEIPEFRTLVESLPKDRETVFDITNLGSTGTLFHDEFLRATTQRPIKWRAAKGWSGQLIKIGISKDRIESPKS